MIIDATDLILGRMATLVAKKALEGEKVDIVNCEEAVLTGNKDQIIARYKQRRYRGVPLQGPYFPRYPDRLVRRVVRGMLPYKKTRGREAFQRVMCHISVPEKFKDGKFETIKEVHIDKVPNLKYMKIKDICRVLGAKIWKQFIFQEKEKEQWQELH